MPRNQTSLNQNFHVKLKNKLFTQTGERTDIFIPFPRALAQNAIVIIDLIILNFLDEE